MNTIIQNRAAYVRQPATRQDFERLFERMNQAVIHHQHGMNPKEFFKKWIPLKYRVEYRSSQPIPATDPRTGQDIYLTYRQACIFEVRLYFPHLEYITIDKSWGKDFEKAPKWFPGYCFLLDAIYTAQSMISQR